jgi:hypothetical protein
MRAQPLGDFHGAVDGLSAYGFVYEAPLFGLSRFERVSHHDVPESRRWSDRARQSLCAARTGQQTEFGLGQTDQIIAVFCDANVAGERELEGASKGGSGNRSDDGFGMVSHIAKALSKKPP